MRLVIVPASSSESFTKCFLTMLPLI